jgi:hypothetical protein
VQKIRGRQIAAASNLASSFGHRIWTSTVSPVGSRVRREFLRVEEFRPVVAGGFPPVLSAGPCGPVVQMQSWCLPPNPRLRFELLPQGRNRLLALKSFNARLFAVGRRTEVRACAIR